MKSLPIMIVLLVATSFYAVPSYANRDHGTMPYRVSGGVIPPICATPDAKTKHPGWFRDGGYCVTPELGQQTGDLALNRP